MGIAGAGWATVLGTTASAILGLALLCLLIWVLGGLALLGAAVLRDVLRTMSSAP